MNKLLRSPAGSSMLVIIMILATLSVCVVTSMNFTSVVSRDVERSNTLRRAHEVADGALEHAFAHWREICRGQTNVQLPTSSFSAIPLPAAAHFPMITPFTISRTGNPSSGATYTVANFKVVATDAMWVPLSDPSAAPSPQQGMSLGTVNYNYLATADVTLPAIGGQPIKTQVRRVFSKSLLSPWNYAIFYVDDLEMHPGRPQSVTGWVHTNSRLYTAQSELTLQSKVSYGDDWSRNYKPGDSRYTPTGTPPGPNWQTDLPPFRDQGQQPFGLDSTRIFNTTDTNANNDSYRELVEVPTASTDPIGEARYYNQAGVKILVNSAGTATFRRQDGTVINSSSTGNDKKLYDAFSPALSVGATITDKREATTVRLMDVDVSVLNTKLTGASAPSFNGIVYISDQSATTSLKRAVRLKKGAVITPPNGLTFATDNGLYIQGDYNTGRTSGNEPPSNTGDPTTPTVSGYTRKPCAVLADAVMILSNNWNDTNSSASLSSRLATPTTVNTAIVSGIVATTGTAASPGNYSGGAENFPRFLESWTGDAFTYYGSMVELFPSKQFNSVWQNTGPGPNVYDPPDRKWFFDSKFFTTPPPGTLTLVSYSKGRWFIE
ncbi:MAG: hypothetical protein QOE70_335 [Chthoniobacter sp.]|jgi:hypothetical protein|nr:hypothetical protein [Chthoniobacter sp.]